jgi:5-oxoprolinase (ATP-hydrolysing)
MTTPDPIADRWEFWIDRGGTFTDLVARDPEGRLRTLKLLSDNPERYPDAALEGIRTLLQLAPYQRLPHEAIAAVKMGTTVATNALLERQGAPTLLAITHGFADALRIATQNRPRLFDRQILLPSMLYRAVAEIDARVTADGAELRALDPEQVRAALAPARAAGIEAIAIVLMHGWRYPEHERAVATIAAELGFTQISVSHRVSPLAKLVGRGDTTVVDAYLSPVLRRYVEQVADALGPTRLSFMQSNGGLTAAGLFQGKDAILSGPAGGIVGAVRTSAELGFDKIIGFDMGGTSTDVAHYAGAYERSFETEIAGVRVRAPMLEIATVAAGGGSICRFEGGRYQVGPESAGADPGPGCFRRGGPLTVTDCNVMLGKLQPGLFPRVFGPSGDQSIDVAAVRERFVTLAAELVEATGIVRSAAEVAEGFVEIAVANMADAIKKVSIERGHDLDDHALCCFGGAGGQHACLVADALGMRTVLIHPLAGVLSAYGIGLADVRALRERSLGAVLPVAASGPAEIGASLAEADARLAAMAEDALAELREQGIAPPRIRLERAALLRYAGSDRPLAIAWISAGEPEARVAELRAGFEAEHRERYGFALPDDAIVIDALTVEAIGASPPLAASPGPGPQREAEPVPATFAEIRMAGDIRATPVYPRDELREGDRIPGPAIIAEQNGTTVVEPGWAASVRATGHLVLTKLERAGLGFGLGPNFDPAELERPDPVRLELFNNLFGSIAEQMGATLRNTAHSVNIKERLDFSCAVFDGEGMLIANAPHMPVHLGSMGASVRAVLASRADSERGIQPGDSYAVNAPYNGGTHLPDLTVITPVFVARDLEHPRASQARVRPDLFVASRGHHADIGGKTPGSMPADSRHVDEEGVLFDDVLIVEQGQLLRAAIRERLASGPWPARDPDQNLADLEAQLAANHKGAAELARMVARWTLARVHAYMRHVRANAAAAVREAITKIAATQLGPRCFAYAMDDGSEVVVRVDIDPATRTCRVDFDGTSAQRPNNFNAPFAVCQAAVLYVFRTLVDAEIPLNEGCLDPIELVVPEGCMLAPRYPAAVVAGNVETSQVIVDALYGALGVMAAAQGTMNNLTFGDADQQYY